jgi:HEPN domain-containing protein
MTPNKNVLFSPTYSPELLKIARGDLQTAKALIDSPQPGRLENILYMIQQAVEKALKAALVRKQIAFPMVHDLGILIALLPSNEYPPGGFDWTALNLFASVRRYEEGSLPVTRQEISAAYAAALLVMDWAEKIVSPP